MARNTRVVKLIIINKMKMNIFNNNEIYIKIELYQP